MKPFLFATFTALAITLISVNVASAAEASTGSLASIADIVVRLDGVHADFVDGSLVVVDDESGLPICVLSSDQDGIVAIVATGTLRGIVAAPGEVDMDHLDAAAVGVLIVDRSRNRWTLTHHFDARRATIAQIEDLMVRFTVDAAAARSRFARELSLGE